MKILLVAATRAEIEPFLTRFGDYDYHNQFTFENVDIDILITGVGMVATAFALGKQLATNQYDLAINVGIAGSFDFDIALGEVVLINEDIFAEQGAEDGEEFLSLKDLGLGETTHLKNSETITAGYASLTGLENLRKVKAITVNKVHGNEFSIAKTLARFNAQVESVEGAAFFYACTQTGTPCLQIRSISNYVERRNKEKWNISLAVKNLNDYLASMVIH